MEHSQQSRLLPWIAATKLTKAALLLIVAFGLHRFRGGHAGDVFEEYVHAIRVDPHNRVAHALLTRITGMSDKRLHQLGLATFLYGALFATEGIGLLLRKTWAEYLTIVSTTVFLPLEVWELTHPGHRILKTGVLLLNIAIVIYLIWNVVQMRKKQSTAKQTSAPSQTAMSPASGW